MRQLTVRGLDAPLLGHLRHLARTQGISHSHAAMILLRRGAGLPERPAGEGGASHWLDRYVGTMTQEEEDEILDCVRWADAADVERRSGAPPGQ